MKKTGIIATIMALMLLLVTSVYAAFGVSGIPDVTMDEDTTDSTTVGDLDDYVTDGPADSWDCPSSAHITTSIDADNVLTLTPDANWNGGPETITCTATKGSNTKFDSFDVTVTPVNDAPVVSVADCTTKTEGIEDVAYTCTVTATDEEDDDITFTSSKGTVTGTTLTWAPTEDDIGSNTITVTATDDGTPNKQGTASFTVFVRPDDVCDIDTVDSGLKITVDITDDDEDFYPGDIIEIEVEVENKRNTEEIENIVVKAILYDVTKGDDIDTAKTDEFDLDENEDETVELILEVPTDIDAGNKFIVFISASGDGDDDEYCKWEPTDLKIKRRRHDVSIEDVTIYPEIVKAGKTVEVTIDVENVGDRDEEDVYVKVKNGDLGVDKKSELFEIEKYEKGDDDEYTVTLTFTVPADTEAGEYDLEVYVYNEDNEVFESGKEFITLQVEAASTTTQTTTTTTGSATISTEGAPENVEQGKAFTIPVEVKNTAGGTKEYKLTVSNIGDWADSTSEFDVYLTAGQSSIYYITITPKADATEGKHSATINLKEGTTIVATKTLSFTIPETETPAITSGAVVNVADEEGGVFQNIFSGTTLWIIADIILVVVAIFFVKMLFSKKS